MRIASWNINSVRIRLPIVKRFTEEQRPDILCLQETKAEDHHFPLDGLKALGYEHVMFRGEKGYNGVAILSRTPLADMHCENFGAKGDCRHLLATLPDGTKLHNLYIPAGGDIPDPALNVKFAHKLRFVDDLTAWSAAQDKAQPQVILGDFNIAPLEHDVWSHKQLLKVVSHTPVEVEKLNRLKASNDWVDTGRVFVPEDQKLYSWWSYRNRDWKKSDRGRRLDHIWISPGLKPRLQASHIVREARDWETPSDHVPIMVDLA